MAKKKKNKAKAPQHANLATELRDRYGLSSIRAQAIVHRYGPSRERCEAAARRLIEIRSLVGPED